MNLLALCETRLREISRDTTHLTKFAQKRLAHMGLAPEMAADTVQRAFLVVLKGLDGDPGKGRHPRSEDLATPIAFENYMRGVISSLVEALSRRLEFKVSHWPLNDGYYQKNGLLVASKDSMEETIQIADLGILLFERLRKRAPRRLLPTIAAWEAVFRHSDRIPSAGRHRKYVGEVRALAQRIIKELGGII